VTGTNLVGPSGNYVLLLIKQHFPFENHAVGINQYSVHYSTIMELVLYEIMCTNKAQTFETAEIQVYIIHKI
jgi:hypothetical protein